MYEHDYIYDWNEEEWVEPEEDDLEEDSDYFDDVDSDEDIDEIADTQNDRLIKRTHIWRQLKINDYTIFVSSEGKIKYSDDPLLHPVFEGLHYQGTPYRFIQINNCNYFVHDIVWKAFYGSPPTGWEVRHKHEYVSKKKRNIYSNHLANLSIHPKTILPLPI